MRRATPRNEFVEFRREEIEQSIPDRFEHYHRYYDRYARADVDVLPLPESVVLNRLGPAPPRPGRR